MNTAQIFDVKNWNVVHAPVTKGILQQQDFERALSAKIPSEIMQVVHLLICLQVLNDVENLSTTTPTGKKLMGIIVKELQTALDVLDPLSTAAAKATMSRLLKPSAARATKKARKGI